MGQPILAVVNLEGDLGMNSERYVEKGPAAAAAEVGEWKAVGAAEVVAAGRGMGVAEVMKATLENRG